MKAQLPGQKSQISLEKAYLDWRNPRCQLAFALPLIIFWSVFNFLPLNLSHFRESELRFGQQIIEHGLKGLFTPQVQLGVQQLSWPTALSFCLDIFCWGNNAKPGPLTNWLFGCHLTNLFILWACVLLLALICLEWTGRFGNRLGAAPAIWAAALFSVYPANVQLVASLSARVDALNCLFVLMALFGFCRWSALKESVYLWLGSLFALLLIANNVGAQCNQLWSGAFFMFLPQQLLNLLLPIAWVGNAKELIAIALSAAYILLLVLLLIRVCLRLVRPSIFIYLGVGMLLLLCLFSNNTNNLGQAGYFYACLPLSLLLTFMALPAFDSSKQTFSRVLSIFGLIALSLIFLSWSYLLYQGERLIVVRPVSLTLRL